MKQRQELPTSDPTIPGGAGSGRTAQAIQMTKPGIPRLMPAVREAMGDKVTPPLIQYQTRTPGETLMPNTTRMPDKPIVSWDPSRSPSSSRDPNPNPNTGRTLRQNLNQNLGGTLAPEETEILGGTPTSGGTQTAAGRTQIRLRKRHQRRKWIVYRKPGR